MPLNAAKLNLNEVSVRENQGGVYSFTCHLLSLVSLFIRAPGPRAGYWHRCLSSLILYSRLYLSAFNLIYRSSGI